jgi:hypothetical protein
MKTLSIFFAGLTSGLTSGISTAQTGNMMDGNGMWSGWTGTVCLGCRSYSFVSSLLVSWYGLSVKTACNVKI